MKDKKINDGGPAFPIPLAEGQRWQGMAPCDGMTLRDYFAAKAMQGILSDIKTLSEVMIKQGVPLNNRPEILAATSFSMADAMIKARSEDNE